jgi:hypothetical protein
MDASSCGERRIFCVREKFIGAFFEGMVAVMKLLKMVTAGIA